MKLWLLERIGPISWDELKAALVRAKSSKQAREIASLNARDEGPDAWQNYDKSTCEVVTSEGDAEVILLAFKNG